MVKVLLGDTQLAESDETVQVDGNHYFPHDALNREFFKPSTLHTVCGWKGTASYYTVEVPGRKTVEDAAWFYPTPKESASHIANRVAFYRRDGIRVEE
jgi:uncharacterized protein (DUF427 family)